VSCRTCFASNLGRLFYAADGFDSRGYVEAAINSDN
jgi:hypothetical protein